MTWWLEENGLKVEFRVDSRQILEHELIGGLLVDLNRGKVKHLELVHCTVNLLVLIASFVFVSFESALLSLFFICKICYIQTEGISFDFKTER
jgi:hypothetical protein